MITSHLSFFPTPYPGEDFRSTIYRYHKHSINNEFNESKKELFGFKSYKNGLIQGNMNFLIEKLPEDSNLTIEYILQKHTFFPLYRPFMSAKKLTMFTQEVKFGSNDSSYFAGRIINAGNPKLVSESSKYCPECMKIEIETLGECFLHLEHQFCFLEVCPKHNVRLISRCPTCYSPLSKSYSESITVYDRCINGHKLTDEIELVDTNYVDNKLLLLKEINNLISKTINCNQETILYQYSIVLGNKGYIHANKGTIKIDKLFRDFLNYYGNNKHLLFLNIKDFTLTKRTLTSLFKKETMHSNPFIHILMMRFLLGTVSDFFSFDKEFSCEIPFGTGPWKCINSCCPKYGENNINSCKRTMYSHVMLGEFQCLLCGFIYGKRWEDGIVSENYFIKNYGHMWLAKIIELRNEGFSIKDIAKSMNISQSVIGKHLKLLKDWNTEKNLEINSQHKNKNINDLLINRRTVKRSLVKDDKKVNDFRNIISRLISKNNDRTDIRSRAKAEYYYLWKYDRDWMNLNLPTKQKNNLTDYIKLDNDLALIIENTAKEIYLLNPSTRIKQYSIINALPEKFKNQVIGNRKQLTRCYEILQNYEESKEDYLIRHVPKLVEQLLASRYKNVTFNSIIAFRRSYRNCSQNTKERIEEILIQMGMEI